ncbi:MAG: hypothetical protein M3X11_02680, partial [Acidobacteriota bacterium]|nr:hypothetical protein [Acidobacteriota bacterium]
MIAADNYNKGCCAALIDSVRDDRAPIARCIVAILLSSARFTFHNTILEAQLMLNRRTFLRRAACSVT